MSVRGPERAREEAYEEDKNPGASRTERSPKSDRQRTHEAMRWIGEELRAIRLNIDNMPRGRK